MSIKLCHSAKVIELLQIDLAGKAHPTANQIAEFSLKLHIHIRFRTGVIIEVRKHGGEDCSLTVLAWQVGGLIGYANTSVYLSSSSHHDDITVSARDTYLGGLIGAGDTNLTACSTKGSLTAKAAYTSYAGGLVGYGDTVTVTDSYATGNVTSTGDNSSRAGELVGEGNSVTVRNSYSVSCVSAESESGNVYIGGIAGYVDSSLTLENAYWYGGDGTAAEYAVGYSNSLGIPTSIGSTRHNSVEEFYTLADALNAGREEPVWEHKGEDTLPTLIVRTDENQQ